MIALTSVVLACLLATSAKPFAPGVRIDWESGVVEIDARVVLRDGLLELLACSPNTREHESILRIEARPLHVFQALGLLGLEPGHPARWDPDTQRGVPASGPPLEVRIRYPAGEAGTREVAAHEWLLDAPSGEPIGPLSWVFSGSLFDQEGRLAADSEGTVLCLVDFDTALIALSESHSASNEALWLRPHTAMIPELGTPCALLLLTRPPRSLHIDRYGRFTYNGAAVDRLELAQTSGRDLRAHPELGVEIRHDPATLPADVAFARDALARAGIAASRITVRVEPHSERRDLDLRGLARQLQDHWSDLARELRGLRQSAADAAGYLGRTIKRVWNDGTDLLTETHNGEHTE